MLLGAPRVGKSTIAATLALAALDNWGAETFLVRSVDEIVSHWRPEQQRQFFWLDDAFGTNQLQADKIDDWNRSARHLMTAIKGGAMVVCTSRLHLFRNAVPAIKTVDFPLLKSSQVLVEVDNLSGRERESILYNHIKLGSSDRDFKRKIRPFLKELAHHPSFSPELARWLGDATLRQRITLDRSSLLKFVAEPVEHLMSLMRGLDNDSFAALGLVFAQSGELTLPIPDTVEIKAFLEALGSSRHAVVAALLSMDESFVRQGNSKAGRTWGFRHPTMRDAYAKLIAENPDLISLYLVGTTTAQLMREVVCWGVELEGASIALEPRYNSVLLSRLEKLPILEQIEFVRRRANAEFAGCFLRNNPDLFDAALALTSPWYGPYKQYLALAIACAELGVLSDDLRAQWSSSATKFLIDPDMEDLDLLETPRLDSLLMPEDAVAIDHFLREEFLGRFDRILEIRAQAYDGDSDPETYLQDLRENVERLEAVMTLDKYEERVVRGALNDIADSALLLKDRYRGGDQADEDYYDRYGDDDVERVRFGNSVRASASPAHEERDVFEDVDED